MSFSLVYLFQRFFYRIFQFARDWFIGGFLAIAHRTINLLESLDRFFALKVTFRYFFQPLYGDYSLIGRALGFVFRTGRLLIGVIVYLIIIAIGLVIYIAWIAIPAYVVYLGFYS